MEILVAQTEISSQIPDIYNLPTGRKFVAWHTTFSFEQNFDTIVG
jgi:hypothetical protein